MQNDSHAKNRSSAKLQPTVEKNMHSHQYRYEKLPEEHPDFEKGEMAYTPSITVGRRAAAARANATRRRGR